MFALSAADVRYLIAVLLFVLGIIIGAGIVFVDLDKHGITYKDGTFVCYPLNKG